nr:M15 family metallopeptidase [uncultured Niameybacter sp.]
MTRTRHKKRAGKNKNKYYILGLTIILLCGGITVSIYSRTSENEITSTNSPTIKENLELGLQPDLDPELTPEVPIYYYENDKEDRYLAYELLHPEMEKDEIIWRVNAGIDQPHYTLINEISNTQDEILLVNKYNKLPDDFVPEQLVPLSSGPLVTPATKEAYEQMVKDARNEGYTIRGASAYRSISYQKDVYNRYLNQDPQEVVDTYSARPGFSEHHTGRTIDLDNISSSMDDFEDTKEAKWITENAYKYGFIVRYPKNCEDITGYMYEPWHITYVGTKIANEMKTFGIETLEEYWVKYVDHSPIISIES